MTMIRAIELEPGDITPLFTVGDWVIASEIDPLLGSSAEIAVREHGARKTAPRITVFRDAMIEVIGCVRCGKDHEIPGCPRRTIADPFAEDEGMRAAAAHAIRPDDVDDRHPEIMKHVRSFEHDRALKRGDPERDHDDGA